MSTTIKAVTLPENRLPGNQQKDLPLLKIKSYRQLTSYSPTPALLNEPRGKRMTVSEGYINKETQIAELQRSGRMLTEWRADNYYSGLHVNGEPSPEEEFYDPTLQRDFDEFEASKVAQQTTNNLNEMKSRIKKEKKNKEETIIKNDPAIKPMAESVPGKE